MKVERNWITFGSHFIGSKWENLYIEMNSIRMGKMQLQPHIYNFCNNTERSSVLNSANDKMMLGKWKGKISSMWITCHVGANAGVGVFAPTNEIESRRINDEAEWTRFNCILYFVAMQTISNLNAMNLCWKSKKTKDASQRYNGTESRFNDFHYYFISVSSLSLCLCVLLIVVMSVAHSVSFILR